MKWSYAVKFKEVLTTSRIAHLESLKLVVCNPCLSSIDPQPSQFLYGVSLSVWCFAIFVNYYLLVVFNVKVILCVPRITQNNVGTGSCDRTGYLYFKIQSQGPTLVSVTSLTNSNQFEFLGQVPASCSSKKLRLNCTWDKSL